MSGNLWCVCTWRLGANEIRLRDGRFVLITLRFVEPKIRGCSAGRVPTDWLLVRLPDCSKTISS
jgi:hypothetical protein